MLGRWLSQQLDLPFEEQRYGGSTTPAPSRISTPRRASAICVMPSR
jgi:hypothetical protein